MIPTLQSLRQLLNLPVCALDRDFGALCDVYLNEGTWTVGSFVIRTGRWLLEDRRVLISPLALRTPFWLDKAAVQVDLTHQEILNSPPVSTAAADTEHHRSLRELLRFTIACKDEPLGAVDDFIGEEPDWTVPYLVAETGSLLSRRRFVPTWLVDRIDCASKTVFVNATLRQIMEGPATDLETPDAAFHSLLEEYFRKPTPRKPVVLRLRASMRRRRRIRMRKAELIRRHRR